MYIARGTNCNGPGPRPPTSGGGGGGGEGGVRKYLLCVSREHLLRGAREQSLRGPVYFVTGQYNLPHTDKVNARSCSDLPSLTHFSTISRLYSAKHAVSHPRPICASPRRIIYKT